MKPEPLCGIEILVSKLATPVCALRVIKLFFCAVARKLSVASFCS
jgi:hypothetical protein